MHACARLLDTISLILSYSKCMQFAPIIASRKGSDLFQSLAGVLENSCEDTADIPVQGRDDQGFVSAGSFSEDYIPSEQR